MEQKQEQQQQQIKLVGMVGALMKKNEGNKLFAQKKYKESIQEYELSLKCLEDDDQDQSKMNEQQIQAIEQQKQQFICLLQNNIAAAHLELLQYKEVIDITSEILKKFPQSVKAIFRRGVAYLQTHQIMKANDDLKQALTLNPGNPEIIKVIETANKRLQNPDYLREAIMKGDTKFIINDPYIYDPLTAQKQKFQQPHENDKNFQLEGARDFDLKKASKHRVHAPKSIDMLMLSIQNDSWGYIDEEVAEDFGFTKLEKDHWHLLLGIYQTLVNYLYVTKEILEKHRQNNTLDQLLQQKFKENGWFNYEKREIQCLYYKHFIQEKYNLKL